MSVRPARQTATGRVFITEAEGAGRLVEANSDGDPIILVSGLGVPVDLSWVDGARFESGYDVMRSTDPTGLFDIVANLPPDSTSYRDTGLSPGQHYWYVVAVRYPVSWYYDDPQNTAVANDGCPSARSGRRPSSGPPWG